VRFINPWLLKGKLSSPSQRFPYAKATAANWTLIGKDIGQQPATEWVRTVSDQFHGWPHYFKT
jgi:hypothetical protein